MATETIRPTDAYAPDAWSTTTNIWDNDTGTSSSFTDLNATPSISVGGAAAGEGTNSWGTKAQTWTDATLYVRFERTGWASGDDDSINVEYGSYSGSYSKIADLVASTTNNVTINTFSAGLTTGNFGAGYANIANLRVRVNGSRTKGPDGMTSLLYEVWVEGTYTAGVERSLDPGSQAISSQSMALDRGHLLASGTATLSGVTPTIDLTENAAFSVGVGAAAVAGVGPVLGKAIFVDPAP